MIERQAGDPIANIPVDSFVNRFNVENPEVVEILHRFPTLCYLLGSSYPQFVTDYRPDLKQREKYIPILNEGSGMFGLKRPQEVTEWRGIFNHIEGSTRHIYFLTEKLEQMTPQQLDIFINAGYNPASVTHFDKQAIRAFMHISHAGRRRSDEHSRYKVHTAPREDPQNKDLNFHSYFYTMRTLREFEADPTFVEMMRVEGHDYLVENARANSGINPDFFDNIYDYCDWTFNQQPVPLATRFEGLRASGRQTPEILDILQNAGTKFEETLKMALGNDIFEQMASAPPFPGEVEIRAAYAKSAGLTLAQVYPDFAARYAH